MGIGQLCKNIEGDVSEAGPCDHNLLAAHANLIAGSGFMAWNVVRGYLPTSCACGVCAGLGRDT